LTASHACQKFLASPRTPGPRGLQGTPTNLVRSVGSLSMSLNSLSKSLGDFISVLYIYNLDWDSDFIFTGGGPIGRRYVYSCTASRNFIFLFFKNDTSSR